MKESLTTKVREQHFGQSPAVAFGPNVILFFNDLCDKIETQDCNDIAERAALGLASPGDLRRMDAIMDSYRRRNGVEMDLKNAK